MLILMSVSHEYGYFFLVGPHFQAFLYTTDYFANAVLYLPFGLVFITGMIEWWRLDPKSKPEKRDRRK